MTLSDVIRELASFHDEDDIYAREPWTKDSEAVVVRGEAHGEAAIQQGLMGFMRVWMAREHLEGWFQVAQEQPSLAEQCERLIHYSKFDA